MTGVGSESVLMASQGLGRLVEEAEKVKQLAFVADVHASRARGLSVRQIAEVLGASKSSVSRALQVARPQAPSWQVIEAAQAFVAASMPLEKVEAPKRQPQSSVVVFDVMREALTNVRGDYAVLRMRADDAGDDAERDRLMHASLEVSRRVDGVDPRDQDAQIVMTQELRVLHEQLQREADGA